MASVPNAPIMALATLTWANVIRAVLASLASLAYLSGSTAATCLASSALLSWGTMPLYCSALWDHCPISTLASAGTPLASTTSGRQCLALELQNAAVSSHGTPQILRRRSTVDYWHDGGQTRPADLPSPCGRLLLLDIPKGTPVNDAIEAAMVSLLQNAGTPLPLPGTLPPGL